jgi:hypothetical protein
MMKIAIDMDEVIADFYAFFAEIRTLFMQIIS